MFRGFSNVNKKNETNGRIYVIDQQCIYSWFADFDKIDNGKIESPTFEFHLEPDDANYSCSLALESKTNPFSQEDCLNLQLSLDLSDKNPNDKVLVEISVINLLFNEKTITRDQPLHCVKNCINHFTFCNFMNKQTIYEKGFLFEGILRIHFKLRFPAYDDIDVHEDDGNVSCDFEQLFLNQTLSDVKFIVDGKEFKVHKCILAARSRVFSAMFDHDMKENNENVVKIDDFSYAVMEELLLFIYSGKVKNITKHASDLLAAANKYDLDSLKVMCEKVLIKNLKIDNVLEYYVLAHHYNTSKLKCAITRFLSTNAEDVLALQEFKDGLTSLPPLYEDMFKLLQNFKFLKH